MCASPYTSRAAWRLCGLQRTLQLSTVEGPPFPRGTTWSISSRTVAPQIPPSWAGHRHFPPSLLTTSRFTWAGTQAFRFACFSRRASSASFSTCSSVAPGFRWDSPALAFFRRERNSREAVMWRRLSVAVRGSTVGRPASILGCESEAASTPFRVASGAAFTPSGRVGSSSTVEPDAPPDSCTGALDFAGTAAETIVVLGTTAAGSIAAASCLASSRESPKNFGRTSRPFFSVITRASSTTVVKQSRPSRTGSSTSGNFRINRAPTIR